MSVELILNPRVRGYEQVQADLHNEFKALGLSYTREMRPPPPGTLSAEQEVVKFIFQHPVLAGAALGVAKESLRLAPAIVEMVRAVLERRQIQCDPKNPVVILIVNNQTLALPASPQKELRFLAGLKADPSQDNPKRSRKSKRKSR